MLLQPQPYDSAVARLAEKSPVASALTSAQWAQMPAALRDRAFFSARVEQLRVVAEMQKKIQESLSILSSPDRAYMDRSKFVADMRQFLGAAPGDSGKLTDLSSRRRLELVYDWQKEDAREFARWNASQDPDLLDSFPAQELLRVETREKTRNWIQRWRENGGQLYEGRMIALKDDPIWLAISRFGRPWPPFDYGSGMGVEDVPRDEAERLGLLTPEQTPQPQRVPFNQELAASVPAATPAILEAFQELFGDQVTVDQEGKISWQAAS